MTIQQLLDMPKDELRVMVVTHGDIKISTWRDHGGNVHMKPHRDYTSDLNAMHDLEQGLTDEELDEFVSYLESIAKFLHPAIEDKKIRKRAKFSAPAHLRAVAYVATKLKL